MAVWLMCVRVRSLMPFKCMHSMAHVHVTDGLGSLLHTPPSLTHETVAAQSANIPTKPQKRHEVAESVCDAAIRHSCSTLIYSIYPGRCQAQHSSKPVSLPSAVPSAS